MRFSLFVLALTCLAVPSFASSDKLVVHEWGTFTSLQDENGQSIGGLNIDDEPLPAFVHDLMKKPPTPADLFSKGMPAVAREDVTMRLETPVMYFHLPSGGAPQNIDVSVAFQGGVLSQFYPDAATNIARDKPVPTIDNKIQSTLSWPGVKVGTQASGPETDSHVWLAPRNVDAANITAGNGESERYLFYRGIGHLDAPIISTQKEGTITFCSRTNFELGESGYVHIPKLWLARFEADGSARAIELGPLGGDAHPSISAPLSVQGTDHPMLDLAQLRASMKQSLVSEGLFDDEAEAMLNTWEKSYFKSSGERLFYIVPRKWTEHYLPLKLSTDADMKRVMIGRLEIVLPEQRATVQKIAGIKDIATQTQQAWDWYSSLGRFKAALIKDEQRQRPSKALEQFVNMYKL